MDDVFAVIVLVGALLWAAAAVMLRLAGAGGSLVKVANYVLEWRTFIVVLALIAVFRVSLYEMFWIPSASMQPTLREGEFVIVDKNDYGIRVPLVGTRIGTAEEPRRGEIVVFRYPRDPDVFYIKRIIGLPGDHLVLDGNEVQLGEELVLHRGSAADRYVYREDRSSGLLNRLVNVVTPGSGEEVSSLLYWESLPEGWHPFLLSKVDVAPPVRMRDDACETSGAGRRLVCVVPPDSFFVMGDNRHRSNDSRFWGFVPRANLVGPAKHIAISFDSLSRFFSKLGLSVEPHAIEGTMPKVGG